MNTIKNEIINRIEINKSIFITYIKPINDIGKAKEYINQLKQEFPDATHHVSGYIIGKGGENGHYTDDGEPSGTAGEPIFEVVRKNNLTNVVFDCIRYFGGIKLGAGGLIRAYSRSISEAIKLCEIVPIIDYVFFKVKINYNYLKLMDNLLNDYIIKREFSHDVELLVKCPNYEMDAYIGQITNITSASAKIEIINNEEND